MAKEDPLTAATISRVRLNGLKLRAEEIRPRTSVAALLDDILEKAGIPEVTEQEFKKKMEVIATK